MKRIGAFLMILVLLAGVCVSSSADAGTYYVKTANKGYLNLRETPSATAKVLSHLTYGTAVNVVLFNNGWAYIKSGSTYGWVVSSNLSSTDPSSSGSSSSDSYSKLTLSNSIFDGFQKVTYTAIVNPTRRTGFVNFRWAPSLNARPIGIRYYGHEVTVLQENGTWCQVYDPDCGISGYIMKEYLLITGYGSSI